jgi:hypothetical protein
MMLALAADIAIKAVTQNAYLITDADGAGSGDDAGYGVKSVIGPPSGNGTAHSRPRIEHRVLTQTPGVVLIDEIDVHLHPKWQRRVISDLKRTFPSIQFVCTSHSPQVIGEAQGGEIRLVESMETPTQAFGMDSNWIVQVLQGGDEQDPDIKRELKHVHDLIRSRQFDEAWIVISELRSRVGNSKEIQVAASTIERMKVLGR